MHERGRERASERSLESWKEVDDGEELSVRARASPEAQKSSLVKAQRPCGSIGRTRERERARVCRSGSAKQAVEVRVACV